MIFALIAYFLTFVGVITLKKTRVKHQPFPPLRLNKNGVLFYSKSTHMIKVDNVKTTLIDRVLYLKTDSKIVIFFNVKDVKILGNNLYFTSCGQTKILFECIDFYRYFALNIKSQQFSLDSLKQLAILDLLNNNFDITLCKITKKYISIIKNILNVHINDSKIIIAPNKFKFSFVVTYKINNKIKRVIINQTL